MRDYYVLCEKISKILGKNIKGRILIPIDTKIIEIGQKNFFIFTPWGTKEKYIYISSSICAELDFPAKMHPCVVVLAGKAKKNEIEKYNFVAPSTQICNELSITYIKCDDTAIKYNGTTIVCDNNNAPLQYWAAKLAFEPGPNASTNFTLVPISRRQKI